MKILITGANGMLADDVIKVSQRDSTNIILGIDISGAKEGTEYCDITDFASLNIIVNGFKPDIVFHLAAETDLEKCERNPASAEKTNIIGTEHVATICKRNNIPIVHISTASIFDGEKQEGCTEDETPNPVNVYGKTKLEAERIVRKIVPVNIVVRLSWSFGGLQKDKKYVGKIINAVITGKNIYAVTDKYGNLSYTVESARVINQLVQARQWGVFHIVNSGVVSRFQIAEKILKLMNMNSVSLLPTTSDEMFPELVRRPRYECLIDTKLKQSKIDSPPSWDISLAEYVKKYRFSVENSKSPED
ncbi:MAG: NAD(P)-dependent oxidoreductase [Bacteroidota bacterium]